MIFQHLLPKIQRTFSYSAPPPRLVPPQMPTASGLQSPDSERDDETTTTNTSDYNSDTEQSAEYHK